MKPDVLERLMVDRALGELSPEVDALVEAYLNRDPEAANLARQTTETLVLTRRALPKITTRGLPAPQIQRWESRRWHESWLVRCTELAACLVLGIGLGRSLVGTDHTAPAAAPVATAQFIVSPARPTATADSRPTYAARLARLRETSRPPARRTYTVIWDSLSKTPRIEQNL